MKWKDKMEIIEILNTYKVFIGNGIIKDLDKLVDLQKYSKVLVIVDENIPSNILNQYEKMIISSGEQNKSIETIQMMWSKLLELRCDRKSLVINLGGGVIGDMGGFAASTFMRGLDFLQIPTTLLASVDASVGGKLGINFAGIKNLVGIFNQPIGVICDVSLLKTLPDREFIEGFGEIIKHGAIADSEYFNFVTSKKPREFNEEELVQIIKKSCEIKKKIIEDDVTEKDKRRLVNFGHTIGHALESISLNEKIPLLHGEAISIGMAAEAKISLEKGILSDGDFEKIVKAIEAAGLPIKLKNLNQEKIMEKIKSDKKSEKGIVYFTLISGIGKAEAGQEVSNEILEKALQFINA